MNATRNQHLIPATLVLLVAAVVAWLSFTQEPAEAFLFPQLISIFFAGLAAWNFVRAATGLSRVGEGVPLYRLKNILPGLVVALIYIFFAARGLGFYVSSSLGFLILYTLYDPVPLRNGKAWAKRIAVTIGFMAVIYGLFALLLKVQTPRGLFF